MLSHVTLLLTTEFLVPLTGIEYSMRRGTKTRQMSLRGPSQSKVFANSIPHRLLSAALLGY